MDRREVNDQLRGSFRHRKAIGTEHHFLHGEGIGETHEDDAGGGGNVARMGRGLRASLDQCGSLPEDRFQTVTLCPAFQRRRAMGNPIIPSPR